MVLKVQCPQCKASTCYEGNPHRPFCSERCKKIDLGGWASDAYAIPGKDQEASESTLPEDGEGGFPSAPTLH